jgi:hypothetical protein
MTTTTDIKPDNRNHTIRIGGKLFRCECGANVFNKPDPDKRPDLYECNGCGTRYEAE